MNVRCPASSGDEDQTKVYAFAQCEQALINITVGRTPRPMGPAGDDGYPGGKVGRPRVARSHRSEGHATRTHGQV